MNLTGKAIKTPRNCYATSSLSLGKYLIVGNPCILMSGSSLPVESILAMTKSVWSLYFSASSSQIGASCLQWPHHGASVNENHCTHVYNHCAHVYNHCAHVYNHNAPLYNHGAHVYNHCLHIHQQYFLTVWNSPHFLFLFSKEWKETKTYRLFLE